MTFAQTMCIIRTKAGAPANMWALSLPTWLMDATFAKQFRTARASGARFTHLTPEQQEEMLLAALGDDD